MRVPSSRARLRSRLSYFDVLWAPIAALTALYLRDPNIFQAESEAPVATYCLAALISSVAVFWAFRLREALPTYFSTRDAAQVVKAGICASLFTTALAFSVTRLDAIPRSAPFIHALVLIGGLLAARVIARVLLASRAERLDVPDRKAENIIVVGANRAAALFINLVQGTSAAHSQVVAVLDQDSALVGRAISRVRILGRPADLPAIVDEFHVHGVEIDRIVVAGGKDTVRPEAAAQVRTVCEARGLALEWLPTLAVLASEPTVLTGRVVDRRDWQPHHAGYLLLKRGLDFGISLAVLTAALPLIAIVSGLVLLDVGGPVLFWQQRVGRNGRAIFIYKFRTLRAPFDIHGQPIPQEARLSPAGRFLRASHLDELPQLLSVLSGDMSLVGPRPLLPIDQPDDPSVRLAVSPGITGWAQIHGGKNLSASAKNVLDEWYVGNVSLKLDVRILYLTLLMLLRGGSIESWRGDAALGGTGEPPWHLLRPKVNSE